MDAESWLNVQSVASGQVAGAKVRAPQSVRAITMNQPDKTDVASGWNSQVLCIGFAGYSAVMRLVKK